MRVVDCVQGSDEWQVIRAGKVTGTGFKKLMATIKTGEAAERRNYRAKIVCEMLTGHPAPPEFVSDEMRWGTDHEAEAREVYAQLTLQDIRQVGFVLHPTNDRIGVSPDGLVGEKGLLEIKCPLTATHLNYLMMGVVPSEYKLQMLGQMLCCEREWCDFMSYDPRLSLEYRYFIHRFYRDEKQLILMEAAAKTFLDEVDATIAQLPNCQTVKF